MNFRFFLRLEIKTHFIKIKKINGIIIINLFLRLIF